MERRLTTERLLSFVGIKVAPDLLDEGERTFAPVLRALREADASIDALDASRWRLADVLTNELSATQNLRAWPCRSLWVDMDDAALVEAARALSPNCSRPFTTCSVGRDREDVHVRENEANHKIIHILRPDFVPAYSVPLELAVAVAI